MSNIIEVTGRVGSDPSVYQGDEGLVIGSVRFAENRGYYNKANEWVEQPTNWFSLKGFRDNSRLVTALSKGQKITVKGRLVIAQWKDQPEKWTAEIHVTSVSIPLNKRQLDPSDSVPSAAPYQGEDIPF